MSEPPAHGQPSGARLGSHGPFFFSFPIIHGSAFAAMLGACSPVNDARSAWQPVRDSSSVAEEWLRLHPGHGRNGLWGIVNGGSSRKGVCLLVPQLWRRNSRCLARSTVGSTQCGIFLMRSCAFGASRRRRAAAASSPGERLHLGTQVCAESSLARFLCLESARALLTFDVTCARTCSHCRLPLGSAPQRLAMSPALRQSRITSGLTSLNMQVRKRGVCMRACDCRRALIVHAPRQLLCASATPSACSRARPFPWLLLPFAFTLGYPSQTPNPQP